MDALITSFIAVGLAEFGDRTQLLAALLAARFGRTGTILAGLLLGALVNLTLAAAAGALVSQFVTRDTAGLLVALALLVAGAAGLFARSVPNAIAQADKGPFLAALAGGFLLEFADKSQFLTFARATHSDAPLLTVGGAAAGIAAACLPALALGARLPATLPVPPIRIAIACALLLAAGIVAVGALKLI